MFLKYVVWFMFYLYLFLILWFMSGVVVFVVWFVFLIVEIRFSIEVLILVLFVLDCFLNDFCGFWGVFLFLFFDEWKRLRWGFVELEVVNSMILWWKCWSCWKRNWIKMLLCNMRICWSGLMFMGNSMWSCD